jgi:hypothetical protein
MNPYQSPISAAADDAPPRTPLPGVLTKRGLLMRTVELPAPYSATLHYRARFRGDQIVQVNGRAAAQRWSWRWFPPCLEFWLDVSSPVGLGPERRPAKLWVEIGLWLNIRRLTIVVDDRVVYDET